MIKKLNYQDKSVEVIIRNPNEHIQKHWMLGSFYEVNRNGMLNHIAQFQKPGKWFDIGASIGNHTLFFAMLGAKVYSFEPFQESFNHLSENVRLNKFKVKLHNLALGNRIGKCSMKPVSATNCGMNQVIEGNDVDIVTIDSMECFEGYDMIKIDVEHFNRELITGGKRTFTKGKGDIYIEAESIAERDEVDQLLGECGYKRVPDLVFNHTPTYLYKKV
jgi:FkbM family methyltransferase